MEESTVILQSIDNPRWSLEYLEAERPPLMLGNKPVQTLPLPACAPWAYDLFIHFPPVAGNRSLPEREESI